MHSPAQLVCARALRTGLAQPLPPCQRRLTPAQTAASGPGPSTALNATGYAPRSQSTSPVVQEWNRAGPSQRRARKSVPRRITRSAASHGMAGETVASSPDCAPRRAETLSGGLPRHSQDDCNQIPATPPRAGSGNLFFEPGLVTANGIRGLSNSAQVRGVLHRGGGRVELVRPRFETAGSVLYLIVCMPHARSPLTGGTCRTLAVVAWHG